MSAIEDIAAERRRQIEAEGWTPEHDDEHDMGEMAFAAAAYAVQASNKFSQFDALIGRRNKMLNLGWCPIWRLLWPWDLMWWKPTDARRDLVKAGALIVAEIERLDRAAAKESS